ncbi:unnamed protein product [Allacma fusca]|uniref:Uncharacterized protein n=1 Tax=Allacma fusca TaxID=39272 RepID=A0A8J2JIQ8_9HEXA|nr:unnamed protein product [Allacma fusca]
MARLQKSLREAALVTVQGMMIYPENLEQVLKTLEMSSYMLNPELTDELAANMKSHLKLKWGKFVLKRNDPISLEHFAMWLNNITNAACITSIFTGKIEGDSDDKSNTFHMKDGKKRNSDIVLTVTDDNTKTETLPKPKICSM